MQTSEKMQKTGNDEKRESFFSRLFKRLEEKDEGEVRKRLSLTVRFLLFAAMGYLVGGAKLFFGGYPLILALACSHKRRILPITVGLLALALFGEVPIVYFLGAAAIIAARVLITLILRLATEEKAGKELIEYGRELPDIPSDKRELSDRGILSESVRARALSGAVGGLFVGIFYLIVNNFSFHSTALTFFLVASTPLLTLLLSGLLGERNEGAESDDVGVWRYARVGDVMNGARLHRLFSLGAIFFLCVFSSLDKTLLGMPMAPFLATLLTLYVCSGKGIVYGALTALVTGAALEIIYLPMFLLIAIVFCLVSAVKRNMGLPAAVALIVVWCYYIGGERGLLEYLPPMLLAIPFYYIADKYREMMRAPHMRDALALSGVYFAEAVTEKTKNEVATDRLDALSGAFSSLSETFYELSNRYRRPDLLGIKRIAEASFEKHCDGCRNREMCLGAEYERTLDAIKSVSSELHKKGSVSAESLPEGFRSVCLRADRIVDEINRAISKTTEEVIRGEKANIFSINYGDITAILKDALENGSEEYESDIELGGKVFELLSSSGIRPRGVVVYGKRCKTIVARGVISGDRVSSEKAEELRCEVSKLVGVELGEPIFEVGKDGNLMVMRSRPAIRAYCAHGGSNSGEPDSKDNDEYIAVDPFSPEPESVCGDTTSAFLTDASYFYSLISDGMGSGGEAAFTSSVCAMFIEKMLSAGNRADITLRMLNNVIRSENLGVGAECSATVDLFELDLMNGAASFIKSGAAPTYVARGGTVYKISSRTMPVGIIKDADARITRFDTQKGDLIVMMSDGCCPDSEDCAWLVEYLCAYAKKSARSRSGEAELDKTALCEEIRDELLVEAVKNYPADRAPDDISVSVVLID